MKVMAGFAAVIMFVDSDGDVLAYFPDLEDWGLDSHKCQQWVAKENFSNIDVWKD